MPLSNSRISCLLALFLALGTCLPLPAAKAGGLEKGLALPYRDFTTTSAPQLMLSQLQTFNATDQPDPRSKKALLAEVAALMGIIRRYHLDAPPHRTDGWSGFTEAEWPLMNIVYTGLAICNLAELYPEFREKAQKEVRHLLIVLKTPAVAGFMEPHFGPPFPSKGEIRGTAIFLHGHYLYLALRYRQVFGQKDEDIWIHRVARAMARDFTRAVFLPSYRGMYFLSDNGTGLAALALHDRLFGTTLGKTPIRAFVGEVTARYLDSLGMMATYVNPAAKRIDSPARGISTMYSLMFLAEAAPAFAARQWKLARKHMICRLFDVVSRNAEAIPMGQVLAYLVGPYRVCLENPHGKGTAGDVGDTDSGPVVFGVGTSATGFAIGTAYRMGDREIAESIESLALIFGDPVWQGDRLYYRNMFHPVGQAIVLYGKTLGLLTREDRKPAR